MISKILFVCLGNICRSPSAEAVFKGSAKKRGMESQFVIDSAGTSGWHVGETSDKRMQKHAVKRGYSLDSVSRQFDPDVDFDRFDIIIGMDDENIIALKRMARDMDDLKKIHKMTDFSKEWNYSEVPDPYYGGDEGFELVLDLLEDACSGLLDSLTQNDIKN
ncbi:MAG: low molecular weight phosphotyrosine protein phosphatase [Prolixibacteraceae bacterium]|jgi:protein-tyrosine phosphatase|nr:low molecular weight phosphotyrosine protein phosphatase [Prolixibacteraceae bacterium]MDD4755818.1 low molecular weight phosphotyrosine protein phosphatase [Prolixibacteraceae bacterium]